MSNKIIYVLAFFSGFLSLSQEIIWMRLISFAGTSVPQAFSYTLALFLVGIAIGAHIGKRLCLRLPEIKLSLLGYLFGMASVIDLILFAMIFIQYEFFQSVTYLGLATLICASARGIIFPLVHHVGTHRSKTGAQISNVYFSNVFGSAIAPLLISFIALDYFHTQQVYFFICALTMLCAFLCIPKKQLKISVAATAFAIIGLMILPPKIFFELSKNSYGQNQYPISILENKHGLIQVYEPEFENNHDGVVYGANVYDGKFNTDLFKNTNGIDRAYLFASLNPQAESLLIIGLSTGSWAQVISYMPNLKKITIVEINPSYVELVQSNPLVSNILKDPRIEIITDDGRKWLNRHPEQKFDMILMNTTWFWRSYSTNLLSQEFLTLAHQHLNEKGIIFYNSTGFLHAHHTAKQVFPHVYQYSNFVLAAKQNLSFKDEDIQNHLCQLTDPLHQTAVFGSSEECRLALEVIKQLPILTFDKIEFTNPPEIITDDNMIGEYKYGKGL